MYYDERKPGWLLPAVISTVILVTSMFGSASEKTWAPTASTFGFALAAVFGFAALYNLGKDLFEVATDNFYKLRQALSMSVDAEILKNAGGVHPQTIRLLFGERQRAWMMKAGVELPEDTHPYSVLYARPDVTEHFLWHFLRNSNNYRCMPKRMLNENSYRLDPLNLATDREQWDQLVSYFQQRRILTQESAPNGTPLWLPPWSPALVAEDFNLDWSEEDENSLPNLAETERV